MTDPVDAPADPDDRLEGLAGRLEVGPDLAHALGEEGDGVGVAGIVRVESQGRDVDVVLAGEAEGLP